MSNWSKKEDTRKGYDVAAIEKMKPLVRAIEAQTREAFPQAGMDGETLHSRTATLSALGTLGSVDVRRLENPQYAATLMQDIDLVVSGAHSPDSRNDEIQRTVRKEMTSNSSIQNGLAQLELASIAAISADEALHSKQR